MGEHTFDRFSRCAAGGVSRRASLVALGLAGLAALARPFPVAARKKNRSGNKAAERCQNELADCSARSTSCSAQAEECTAFLSVACAGEPTCPNLLTCCLFLDRCNASAFLTCLDAEGI
jgi:hypothetical protein